MPKCPQCGARVAREDTACQSCGAVLGVEAASVLPVPQAAPAQDTPDWLVETGEAVVEEQSERSPDEALVEGPPAEEAGRTCARCRAHIPPGEALLVPSRARGQQPAICPKCLAEIEAEIEAETQDLDVGRGALFGLGAAILCGAVWYLVVHFTQLDDLPVMGFVAGWLTAEAVRFGAGRKRGQTLQWISLGLTALTILVLEYVLIGSTNPAEFLQTFGTRLGDPFTLILLGWGLWQAYSIPRPRRLAGIQREAEPSEPAQ